MTPQFFCVDDSGQKDIKEMGSGTILEKHALNEKGILQ